MINPNNAYERIRTEIDKSDILDEVTKSAIKKVVLNGLLDESTWQAEQNLKELQRTETTLEAIA